MKKSFVAMLSFCLSLAVLCAGCGSSTTTTPPDSTPIESSTQSSSPAESGPAQTDRVVLYSASSTNQNEMIQSMWNSLHPDVELEIVSAGSGELQNRIIAEAGNPQGDVMMGGSYAVYSALEDNLTPYVSPNIKDCIPEFISDNEKFTAIQINVNTIMVNNGLMKKIGATVDGWESLLNPALKGNIIFADPSSSSSGREQIINMLAAMNKTGKMDDGWSFVEEYLKNLDGKISSSSSAIYTGVANGEYAVGITNEEKVIENVINGADVSPVYAKEGITLRNSYCGIIKGCANEYNAKLLVDFFTSFDYQKACTAQLYQRSVRSDVDFDVAGVTATKDLNAIAYPTVWVDENKDTLKEKIQEIWTAVS